MEQLNYKQQLDLINKRGISATDLYIADEVDSMAIYTTDKEFNQVCALVKNTYFDTTDISIYDCARAITILHSKLSIKQLWEMTGWERLETYEANFKY